MLLGFRLCKHIRPLCSSSLSPSSSSSLFSFSSHSLHPSSLSSSSFPSLFHPSFIVRRHYASEIGNFRVEKENDIVSVLNLVRKRMNYKATVERLKVLEEKSQQDDFWENSTAASAILRSKANLEQKIASYDSINNEFDSYKEFYDMGTKEGDKGMINEALTILDSIHARVGELEMAAIMSDPADSGPCYLEIHAGAGGTEAMDWSSMILRMYTNWSHRRKLSLEVLQMNSGDVGIKSVVTRVSGDHALTEEGYGWLRSEHGIHRLIRVSPFDSNGKRHTSFCSVSVIPIVDDTIEIEINQKDLKVETMRSGGAGGQHVNKTESAVRITHIPTGIAVHCSNQRSQHHNREEAMKILKGRLYQLEAQKKSESAQAAYSSQADNAWGSQIRTYTLHPGSRVKDQRTNYETSDVDSILDGTDELDVFMRKALQFQAALVPPTQEE